MLNGLDIFSGIGGMSIALQEWVRPIAYCEIDPYCQGILLSRMSCFQIANSPIWDNIETFPETEFDVLRGYIDIIYGGFPCQDISIAGRGKGLGGERSRLFFEIVRLSKEIKPPFIFLENVPAITSRGGLQVVREIAEMGYDCRWCVISAASIGALHRRERWFLLGHSKHDGRNGTKERRSSQTSIHPCSQGKNQTSQFEGTNTSSMLATEPISIPNSKRLEKQRNRASSTSEKESLSSSICGYESIDSWQEAVSGVCRVTDGVPQRSYRLRALGNAVVPMQAREAFRILSGIEAKG
jgi:DNA (cytosine-5)-methyltransferase 1